MTNAGVCDARRLEESLFVEAARPCPIARRPEQRKSRRHQRTKTKQNRQDKTRQDQDGDQKTPTRGEPRRVLPQAARHRVFRRGHEV